MPEAELAQELQGSCWTVGPGECPWGHGEATAGTWGVAGAEASVPIAPGEPGLSSGSARDQLRTFWSRVGRDIQGKAGAVGSCAWFSWCFEEKEWFGWELCSPGPQEGRSLIPGPAGDSGAASPWFWGPGAHPDPKPRGLPPGLHLQRAPSCSLRHLGRFLVVLCHS